MDALDPAVPGAGRYGPGIRVGQGDLAVQRVSQGLVHRYQPGNLLSDAAMARGEMMNLLGAQFAFLLPVNAHHIRDVARDIGLKMRQAAGDLARGDVAGAGVYSL